MRSVFASFLRLSESHLQPYVIRAATVCDPGCNRMRSGLQPYAIRAATACDPGCNRALYETSGRRYGRYMGRCRGGVRTSAAGAAATCPREIQGRYRGDAGEMCAHLLLKLLPLARGRDQVDDVHEDGVEDRLQIQGRYSEIWEV